MKENFTYGRKLCSHIRVLNYCLYEVIIFFSFDPLMLIIFED